MFIKGYYCRPAVPLKGTEINIALQQINNIVAK